MLARTATTLDRALSIFSQAEYDNKGQRVQVLRALANQKEPKKPAEIAGITGLKQPSVRRIIQSLVREGLAKRHPNNKYDIIK